MNTVIAPIDFSRASRGVVDEAIRLARSVQGRVLVLHVVRSERRPAKLAPASGVPNEVIAEMERAAQAQLLLLQRRLMKKGISVETLCTIGSPMRCIVEQAQLQAARYVVLGSHGQGDLRELVVGDMAGGVLRQAGCPVVVVPLGRKPAAA